MNNIAYNWGLILILSILGFLAFNLSLFGNERKIFLGDHGSTGLGYIVSWNLIYLSQETDLITPVSSLWFIFFPLTDTVLIIIRRIRSLLHEQGYTIAGARSSFAGEEAKEDASIASMLVKQTIEELEEVLKILKS